MNAIHELEVFIASKHLVLNHRITYSIYEMNFFHQVTEPSRFYCAKPPVASRGQGAIPPSIKRVLCCPWFFWWILFIGLFFSLFVHNSMDKVLFLLALFIVTIVFAIVYSRRMKVTRHFKMSMINFYVKLMSSVQNIRCSNLNSRSSQM